MTHSMLNNVHGPNYMRPPPDLIKGEEEYKVEAIITHQGSTWNRSYHVWWKHQQIPLFWAVLDSATQSHRVPSFVKSGSTPVGGLVKSGRRQTKEEGRGLDKRLVQPELETAWIQWLRTMSVDPLRRFQSRGGVRVRDGDRQEQE